MIQYMLVEAPVIFPFQCSCGNSKGPMVDTHRERGPHLHEYVCLRCVKEFAKLAGFTTGAKADELEEAAGALEERDRQIASLRDELTKANASRASTVTHDQHLSKELVEAQERIAQLEGVIRKQASQSLSLVGVAGGTQAS